MKLRLILVVVGLSLWLGGIVVRLGLLQLRDHAVYLQKASDQQQRVMELDPPRGTIYDARGRELAVSMPVDSLYAVPRQITDPKRTAALLAPVLGMERSLLEKKLTGKSWWVSIERKLDPPKAARVRAAVRDHELAGIGFAEDSKRYYPMLELAAPVLGYVGTDNSGLSGLELVYDERIAGHGVQRPVLRDNKRGSMVTPDLAFVEATPGEDLHLTLDATIQHVVEEELARAVLAHDAKGGTAVILDPRTGAILALASYPSYDANQALEHQDLWRIRPIADYYEPGSSFKVFTAAAALEAGEVDPTDVFNCEMGGITLYKIRINDHKKFGMLTFRDVLAKSSNVGVIKVGQMTGRERLFQTFRAFGFGEKTGVDLHGEIRGSLRDLRQWTPITPAYLSFGQGIGVTSLQLAAAVAAVGNGGTLYQPYLVAATGREGQLAKRAPREVGRPIGPRAARELERMLEAVLEEGGTAFNAAIAGYRIAGKTGTAQKTVNGRYDHTHFTPNFVGFAPARAPVLAGVVTIDEPRSGVTSAGTVAAPAFTAIVRRVLPYLGVAPDRTEELPELESADGVALPRTLLVALAPPPRRKGPEEDPGPEHAGLEGDVETALAVSDAGDEP